MITAELISYINDQKTKGKTKENIVSNLLSVGWELNDIEDGFKTIEGSDRYREPITEDDVLDPDKPITDASSFYPQKASFSQEEKTDAKLAEEIKPDIKTSEVETKKEENYGQVFLDQESKTPNSTTCIDLDSNLFKKYLFDTLLVK